MICVFTYASPRINLLWQRGASARIANLLVDEDQS